LNRLVFENFSNLTDLVGLCFAVLILKVDRIATGFLEEVVASSGLA